MYLVALLYQSCPPRSASSYDRTLLYKLIIIIIIIFYTLGSIDPEG